ncbi:NADPH-dependent FMN reductase [Polluticaenibacter yanchengensis]|uniref:NAD(P)H-dependent oxidoreductase n=1 Tax=Polluticaenibacter yanchengensis TaxID=3014562 RepID=A0ABT4UK38_9BACT|nr:NAD(P)H-dependent oxidoreductase [Chitinophagaceae bacterium LY-5]
MKILVFAASNSSKSINNRLVTYVARQFAEGNDINHIRIHDYEMPIYQMDREAANGIPQEAHQFAELIDSSDLIIISLAEHNSNFSVGFKNIYDWVSRIKGRKPWNGKKLFLLSTSEGARGGGNVMDIALNVFPRHSAEIVGHFSLPQFSQNFNDETGVTNAELNAPLEAAIEQVKTKLNG